MQDNIVLSLKDELFLLSRDEYCLSKTLTNLTECVTDFREPIVISNITPGVFKHMLNYMRGLLKYGPPEDNKLEPWESEIMDQCGSNDGEYDLNFPVNVHLSKYNVTPGVLTDIDHILSKYNEFIYAALYLDLNEALRAVQLRYADLIRGKDSSYVKAYLNIRN